MSIFRVPFKDLMLVLSQNSESDGFLVFVLFCFWFWFALHGPEVLKKRKVFALKISLMVIYFLTITLCLLLSLDSGHGIKIIWVGAGLVGRGYATKSENCRGSR